MPQQTVTLSSVGTSGIAALNWRGGKPCAVVVVSTSAGSSASFVVQFTYDDVMLTAPAAVSWLGASSNPYGIDTSPGTIFSASAVFPDGVNIPFPVSPAAVRLNSSAMAASNTLTMKIMQGEGW